MATIHINTDLMRQLGQYFVNLNETIANNIQPQIHNISGQLENDWQGQSAYSLQNWGNDIGQHIYHTADQFDNADRSL